MSPPATSARSTGTADLDRAVAELQEHARPFARLGPAARAGLVRACLPRHPSATLADVQSGTGWVHNTHMLGGIDKVVLRGPIRATPTPPWFADHPTAGRAGSELVALEADPRWVRVPGVLRQLV